MLNRNADIIHLVGDILCSAAFDVFFQAKCSRELTPTANGMYHLASSQITVGPDGFVFPFEENIKFANSSIRQLPSQIQTMFRYGFTDTEQKQVLDGEDVYFDYERLTQLLAHVQSHPKNMEWDL